MRMKTLALASILVLLGASACSRDRLRGRRAPAPDPCVLALSPHAGDAKIDREIVRLQQEARVGSNRTRALERLGWAYVNKARTSFDAGYYKLAEQCADCIESQSPSSPDALLIRGHVLHNLHRFKEAEIVARRLIELRGAAFDHGLLGDALMERGLLGEAGAAYQTMLDLKPSLQSYSRAAHLRWLRGDLKGAIALERMAAGAGSPRDPESLAWTYTRLSSMELQARDYRRAAQATDAALAFVPEYAPALLARGRIFLAQGKKHEAVEALRRAVARNPLPEYQWTLAEAYRFAGRTGEARAVEAELERSGAGADPRTFALYLATRRTQPATAVRLAEHELSSRGDAFTLDALAWARAAAGEIEGARETMARALAQGTPDARLHLHAGVIARASGRDAEAREWLRRAAAADQMLLPSEREELARQLAAFRTAGGERSS